VHVVRLVVALVVRSVEIYIFVGSSCSVCEQIVVHLDFFFRFLHIFLAIAQIVVFSITIVLSCLSLLVFFENNVLGTIVGVLEEIGIDLEESATGDEIHIGFVLFALGFLLGDSLF